MFQHRRAAERGHFDHGWLDTYHTFSFGEYFDPDHMQFRALRVMNEDRVLPREGFGMHPHRDMEILTYVLSGELQHRDSMGNGSIVRAGELQRMTAGTGIFHSEQNPSSREPVHLYQIWILPEQRGLAPSYEQKSFPAAERAGRLRLVASRDGREDSVRIHQDAEVYLASLRTGDRVAHSLRPGRHAWLQVLRGTVTLQGEPLQAGDGVAISAESAVEATARDAAELLLFDLA